MLVLITSLTVFHAILFAYDEYVLKRKRVLSQNEINGATLDGVLYIAIIALTIFTSFTPTLGYIYIFLGALSCLSIVKNEFFYPLDLCRRERIVHSLLYVLHPLILYCFYQTWSMNFFITNLSYWIMQLCYLVLGFKTICYHVIYWNYIHKK